MSKDAAINTDHKGVQRDERRTATTTGCCSEMLLQVERPARQALTDGQKGLKQRATSFFTKGQRGFRHGHNLVFLEFSSSATTTYKLTHSSYTPEDRTEQTFQIHS